MNRVCSRFLFSCLICLIATIRIEAQPQQGLLTRPEKTEYEQTSRYEDVVSYIETLDRRSNTLKSFTFGYTTEGRGIPAVWFDRSAETLDYQGVSVPRTRVLVIGNIHAGEVCGKEAILWLLRDLTTGIYDRWLDSLSILFVPIYNADGNERINLFNRPQQNGPLGGMGQRANASGYDLNRDFVKLDAPESRSLVRLIDSFDPHVIIDLHTTDGTYHAYHLTFDPPLNPNTSATITSFMRENWIPALSKEMKEHYGYDIYYYGNLPWPGTNDPRGWYTYDHRPRFGINYAGMRNRFGMLSEAYAYLTFKERIEVTLAFMSGNLEYVFRNAATIAETCRRADHTSIVGQKLALRARYYPSKRPVEILLGEVDEQKNPYSGAPMLLRKNRVTLEMMTEYGQFEGLELERVPADYFIPDSLTRIVDLLSHHGITCTPVEAPLERPLERFVVDSVQTSNELYEGHRRVEVTGSYRPVIDQPGSGLIRVTTDQPLGRLVFYLLEPRSDDGIVMWGLLPESAYLPGGFPLFRSVD